MDVYTITCEHTLRLEARQWLGDALAVGEDDRDTFYAMVDDPETRDIILSDERLHSAVENGRHDSRLPADLRYFILLRQALKRVHLEDANVACYLAHVLARFESMPKPTGVNPADPVETICLVDLLRALQKASADQRFLLRSHIGNFALYITGLFPERLRYHSQYRSLPDFPYYEQLGRSNYEAAAKEPMAWEFELDEVFATLAKRFRSVRIAFNDLAERRAFHGQPFINHRSMLAELV